MRKEYPHLDATYAEYPISPKIDAVFEEYRLAEQAFEKRKARNGNWVSWDTDLIVNAHIVEPSPGPEEETIHRIQNQELYRALRSIPRK